MNSEDLLNNIESLINKAAYSVADRVFLCYEIKDFRKDLDSGVNTYDDTINFCKSLESQYLR